MSDQIAKLMSGAFAQETIPDEAQRKLDSLYERICDIPQSVDSDPRFAAASAYADVRSAELDVSSSSGGANADGAAGNGCGRARGRRHRAAAVLAAAVAATLAIGGAAYGGARLLGVGSADVPFFHGAHLPIYDSMEQGASSVSVEVGQTVHADGVQITLDSVSCDRNVANVYLTLERDGGFNMDALSIYEGSQENEWTRLQRLVPLFRFAALDDGHTLCEGDVRVLDAYLSDDGAVKCMVRLVPEEVLPDYVDLQLHAESPWTKEGALCTGEEGQAPTIDFSVGLDLSSAEAPRGFKQQVLKFQTSEGMKKLPVKRFTVSELGCVLVTSSDLGSVELEDGNNDSVSQAEIIDPNRLKISDDAGNVLQPVDAGDGHAASVGDAATIEYAGIDHSAANVTFTPYSQIDAESFAVENVEIDAAHIGSKLATSEYGGYELAGCDIADGAVSITLKPYGMTFGFVPELITVDLPTTLETQSLGPDGESHTGRHVGIRWQKQDYATGDVLQMTSYYAATDEELRSITAYSYISLFGTYQEEGGAALTCSLQ